MKIFVLLSILTASVFAGEIKDLDRIIDGKECNIRPFIAWYKSGSRTPNPMPVWRILSGKVVQTVKNGIYIEITGGERYFIKSYPHKIEDGASVELAAVARPGTWKFTDALGVERNVKYFDYGKLR